VVVMRIREALGSCIPPALGAGGARTLTCGLNVTFTGLIRIERAFFSLSLFDCLTQIIIEFVGSSCYSMKVECWLPARVRANEYRRQPLPPPRSTPPLHKSSSTFSPSSSTTTPPSLCLYHNRPDMSEGAENQDAQIAQLASLTGLDPATVGRISWKLGALTNTGRRQNAT
jgi:hypothetical protein